MEQVKGRMAEERHSSLKAQNGGGDDGDDSQDQVEEEEDRERSGRA